MIDRMRRIWAQAFGDPEEYLDLFFETAYSPDRCWFTGQAMAFWFDCRLEGRKLAYLYAVAVDPACQGRGLGTAMLRDLHRHLARKGYAAAVLVPSTPDLFRFYERLGYDTVSYVEEYTVTPSEPIALPRLTTRDYAQLRRQYPVVLQEGENLALLEKTAEFYGDDRFLAAVDLRGKRCLEFLGDAALAPGLAAALGLEQCRIRTPGRGRPFAMALSLNGPPLPCPIHFGFAFD